MDNLDLFKPFPLSTRAVYWMVHFDTWAHNFLRERLAPMGYKAPYRVVPDIVVICPHTGVQATLPADPRFAEETIAEMERFRMESIKKRHGSPQHGDD